MGRLLSASSDQPVCEQRTGTRGCGAQQDWGGRQPVLCPPARVQRVTAVGHPPDDEEGPRLSNWTLNTLLIPPGSAYKPLFFFNFFN